ncbi:MAG TPA: hypothetical protein DIT39_02935 [Tissierellales bacterium]|jgi:hypothetical protein|nr:hypothetical protein [Tissierellales bacterium]
MTHLPEPYHGKNQLKAILLGADPTNNGVRANPGMKRLGRVFGINSKYEKDFFNPQKTNLTAIGLDKDDLYIQNVCRNYFMDQTSKNEGWQAIAKLWLPYLAEELSVLNSKLPVLATAEKIMKILVPNIPTAKEIYNMIEEPSFYSTVLNRSVYALYRNKDYILSVNYPNYRNFIKQRLNG